MARTPKTGSTGLPTSHRSHVVHGQEMEAVYRVPGLQPKAAGPWRREAEKIAWTDPQTGLACIVRREQDGNLAGYVAVEPGHPLYGFDAHAIPREAIQVHGGLSYSAPCDETGPEAVSVCHVSDRRARHDDKWWLGFACDKIYDFVPENPFNALSARTLGIEQTYRDEEYVVLQCMDLAAQLNAAATGEPAPPRRGPPPPPVGLNPGEN